MPGHMEDHSKIEQRNEQGTATTTLVTVPCISITAAQRSETADRVSIGDTLNSHKLDYLY